VTAQAKPKMRVLSMIGPRCLCDGASLCKAALWNCEAARATERDDRHAASPPTRLDGAQTC